MFWKKQNAQQEVQTGRFELEQDGQLAYLEYTLAGDVLGLMHSEVPPELRGHGVASSLAHTALEWAPENGKKVDVICPLVEEYIARHPEYADLVLK